MVVNMEKYQENRCFLHSKSHGENASRDEKLELRIEKSGPASPPLSHLSFLNSYFCFSGGAATALFTSCVRSRISCSTMLRSRPNLRRESCLSASPMRLSPLIGAGALSTNGREPTLSMRILLK